MMRVLHVTAVVWRYRVRMRVVGMVCVLRNAPVSPALRVRMREVRVVRVLGVRGAAVPNIVAWGWRACHPDLLPKAVSSEIA